MKYEKLIKRRVDRKNTYYDIFFRNMYSVGLGELHVKSKKN